MIGDNPESDIRGGNNNGCISILVKSGVFTGISQSGSVIENSEKYPAQFVVNNMYEAYKLILEREEIQDIIKFDN